MGDGYNPVQGSGCIMLRKVRLYGELAKVVGRRVLEAELSSAAEAELGGLYFNAREAVPIRKP